MQWVSLRRIFQMYTVPLIKFTFLVKWSLLYFAWVVCFLHWISSAMLHWGVWDTENHTVSSQVLEMRPFPPRNSQFELLLVRMESIPWLDTQASQFWTVSIALLWSALAICRHPCDQNKDSILLTVTMLEVLFLLMTVPL